MSKIIKLKSQSGLTLIIIALIVAGIIIFSVGIIYFYQQSKIEERSEIVTQPESEITEIGVIEYPDVFIFYEDDNQIWQFNPKTEIKKQIANGIRAVVSPTKTKIAYTYQGWNKYFKSTETNLTGIHIFDITTGEDKLLKYYDPDFPVWETSWSQDSKYLVVDTGTSPVRGKTVIDSNTGEEIASFTTYGKSFVWLNDNEIVFSDVQDITEPRPYGGGEGMGIAIININGQKKILKTATLKKDYNFVQLLNDGRIYFSLRTVTSNEGWTDDANQIISYWTMDKFGNNLIPAEKIESLEDKIRKLLLYPYNEYKSLWHASQLTDNKDWVVFVLNDAAKTQLEDEVFIMDLDNPKSIKKIGNGTLPGW